MSTSGLGVESSSGAPITITGLASGLETTKIIAALMSAERAPVTHLSNEEAKLQAEQSQLQGIQSSLQQLTFAASEFSLPSLFESSQAVTSNEPDRVSATSSSGAGVGGYEVEVTKLANAAQRTFTFASPTSEQAVTIDGQEFTLKVGETAKELANAINKSTGATVYAAALESGAIVLSNRATGSTGGEFIAVTDPGGALTEQAETAKEGQDAEYKVDGVVGESSSNTVTGAIPGVTLTLNGEYATGILFGDVELTGVLDSMRDSMYEPIAGLEAEMSSPLNIGISTGAATGGSSSQSSLEGLLTLDPAKLSEALETNPAGVQKMLEQWSQNLQATINNVAAPGGALESRSNGDGAQITQLSSQINTMNEMLAHREKALQATYAALEGVISRNSAQSAWLTQQEESLSKQGI